jgi:hypothetical protein
MRVGPALAATLALFMATPGQSLGQDVEVVGTAIVRGQRVELLSDQTWRLAETVPKNAECAPIRAGLVFCGSPLEWWPTSVAGSDFTRVFKHDSRTYGGIIFEELGTNDGLTIDGYRSLILSNFADGVRVPPEDIPVALSEPISILGKNGEIAVYGGRVEGLTMIFANSFYVGPDHSFQIVTWNIETNFTDEHAALHESFVAAVRDTKAEPNL